MDGGGSKQNRVRTANSQLKNEHGRSFFSVPAGVFCTLLASAPPISKKANGERLFRTDTDVREIEQQRVCPANSTLNSVHGRTLFNSATDGGGSKQNRVRTANSQLKNEHGRSFFSVPAVNLCSRLVVSERTRMSGVLISSDVFAAQKPVVRTPKDGRDINQKRVLYKTRLFPIYTEVCREKVYTDVHFRTGYLQKS